MPKHNLLTDPLFTWRDVEDVDSKTSLPGLLARLCSQDVESFPRVRVHHQEPWLMFLIQLGGLAAQHVGATLADDVLTTSEEEWRRRLLALTNGAHEPWCLVVEDETKPAFFQPPRVEAKKSKEPVKVKHPDEIDILYTGKAIDIKYGLVRSSDVEAWAYALVVTQTMQGYAGPSHYGITRMNGGLGNRAKVGIRTCRSAHTAFCRDVLVLLKDFAEQVDENPFGFTAAGIKLMWLVPWDPRSETQLELCELAPHYIEICKSYRLEENGQSGGLACSFIGSGCMRVRTPSKGNSPDLWTVVEREDATTLTLSAKGWTYQKIAALLNRTDWAPSKAQEVLSSDKEPFLQFWALVRGQGITEGLHQRHIPIAAATRRLFGSMEGQALLARKAHVGVEWAREVKAKVLSYPLRPLKVSGKAERDFESRVDAMFFPTLQEDHVSLEDYASLWTEKCLSLAECLFADALDRCALPQSTRLAAIAKATLTSRWASAEIRKNKGTLTPPPAKKSKEQKE